MKILLINGGAPFNGNGGKLSKTLHELAKNTLEDLGHETRKTTIHEGYDLEGEVEKISMDGCRDLADARVVDGRALGR